MNKKRVERNVNIILTSLEYFKHTISLKDPGFNFEKIDPLFNDLVGEVSKQGHKLIANAAKPKKARSAKKILAEIKESGKLTPELLEEINKSL